MSANLRASVQTDAPQPRVLLAMVLKSRGDLRGAMGELRLAEAVLRRKPTPKPTPELERVQRLMAATRAQASDSLRAVFAADSAAMVARRRTNR